MTEIFTAKTVDEAKDLAAKKFGKDKKLIKFEILDEGKKGGLFGIGAKDAKVKATFTDTAAVKPVAAKPAEVKKTEAPKAAETVSEPAKPVVKAEEKPVEAAAPKAEAKSAEEATAEINDDEQEYSLDNFTLIEDENLVDPKVKLARDYITRILRAIGVDAEYVIYQNETGAIINIQSDNNGTIIGRRGETLDAIQYLCSIIANKGDKEYYRITIDCLGYRSKRKETLEQLAAKVAKSVLRTGRAL